MARAAKPVKAKAKAAAKAAPKTTKTPARPQGPDLWLAAGLRTPFARVGGALSPRDALQLGIPVVKAMLAGGMRPDLAVWGAVAPNLTWSNLARELMLESKADPSIPAYTTVMACSTSMVGAFTAAGLLDDRSGRSLALVGGSESMSRIQLGLTPELSDDLREVMEARTLGERLAAVRKIRLNRIGLYVPKIKNRATGKSMGEHTEVMAKAWGISREEQDELALASHQKASAAWTRGFFGDLVLKFGELAGDSTVRPDTSLKKLAKLKPAFDQEIGRGTITAGNSSPLTDGAAAVWVATAKGLARLPRAIPRARLVDWEVNAIDLFHEHLLMAPAYAIPRLLARNGLAYKDVALWEIHEAFAAQVGAHLKALQDPTFLKEKAQVTARLGRLPVDRMNPNGGSIALGHPFGATGARILSQAVKELAAHPAGSYGIVSICADGGQGTVALLRNS